MFTHGSHQTAPWLPVDEGGDSFPHKRLLRIYIIQSNNNTLASPHSSTCASYKDTAGKGTENLIYVKKEGKKIENRSVEQKVGLLQEFKLQ